MAKNNIIDIGKVETGSEPVTLAQIKEQCIVTFDDDNTLLTRLGKLARTAVENYCNISIIGKTVTLIADLYNEWELPYGPVVAVTSVKSRSTNEGSGPLVYSTLETGWATDGVEFKTFIPGGANSFNPSELFRGYFQWGHYASPYGQPAPYNRYQITYTTGYTTVPDDLKQAILMQVAYMYERRGEEPAAACQWSGNICEEARLLANPYIRQAWI